MVPARAGAPARRGFALQSRDPMIHRTSPFVFFGSPSPFRRTAHRSPRRRVSLPACPSVASHRLARSRYPRGPFTIALPAVSSFLVTFFAHFHRFPAFFRSPAALGDSPSLKLSSAGRWAPEDFIPALFAPRKRAREMCVHVRVTTRNTTPFISS